MQNNSVRVSHRENGFWSVEIPNSTWVSRATLVEAIDELYRVENLTPDIHLANMQAVGRAEIDLNLEHKRLYG
jgi:hypothetical protein